MRAAGYVRQAEFFLRPDDPRMNVMRHNLTGMPGGPIMPGPRDEKRDWAVDTMDPPALHDAALLCMRTAFGFLMSSQAMMALPQLQAQRPALA